MTSYAVSAAESAAKTIGEDLGLAAEKFASSGVQFVRNNVKSLVGSKAESAHKQMAGVRSARRADKNSRLLQQRRSQISLVNAPAMRICWHPHHPLPPVMSTTLGQTHVMHATQKNGTLYNTLCVDCVPQHLAIGSAVNNYGFTAGSARKKLPYYTWLLTYMYEHVICTGARIKATFSGRNFNSTYDYRACMKLELDSSATATNMKWANRAGAVSTDLNQSSMYFDSFENQSKGGYLERAPLLDDHTLTARLPSASAEEGPMEAHIRGHWSLYDHAGVNPQEVFLAKIRGEDVSGAELLEWCKSYGQVTNPHRPVWHMFVIPLDYNKEGVDTQEVQVRLEVEYDLQFFGIRNPDVEAIIDELPNTS